MTDNNWEILKSIIGAVVLVLQYAVLTIFVYQFIISIFGWIKRKEENAEVYAPVNRFALIIAAHNEETVIGNIVRNLKRLQYPQDLYDIYVIADNCYDNTAKVAAENGATVLERFDSEKKGKGFAMKWAFDKILNVDGNYNAVGIFDADNLVSPNFLREMNKHLCKGDKVIQGYLDSKNPSDTWVSGNYSIAYWISNRIFQLPRYYLGLCCALGGTGFVMTIDVLKEIGWNATCLTEDLEFSLQLVLRNMKVSWCHEAVVFDEKPISLNQSWRQRKRWMQGQADCAGRYLKYLLSKAFKDRDIIAFDCAVYLLQPLTIVLSGIVVLSRFLRFIFTTDPTTWLQSKGVLTFIVSLFFTYFMIIFVLAEGKLSRKVLEHFILFPCYGITWIPIIIQGFFDRKKTVWSHTKHTRAIDIKDIKNIKVIKDIKVIEKLENV